MSSLLDRVSLNVQAIDTVRRMGMLDPRIGSSVLKSALRWGPTLAAGYAAAAARRGDDVAIVDDDGPITFRDVHEQSSALANALRSEEHTSELQSLMRISYAVFCLKKKTRHKTTTTKPYTTLNTDN